MKIRLGGAPTVSETFLRKTDAKCWAQASETAIREGQYFKHAAAKRVTLAEVLDRYEREVLPRKRSAGFQARQLDWWRSQLGDRFLIDITANAIATAREKLLAEPANNGRPRGAATANRYLAALSHVLSTAMREGELISDNAARKLSKLREAGGRDRFLSERECEHLLTQSPSTMASDQARRTDLFVRAGKTKRSGPVPRHSVPSTSYSARCTMCFGTKSFLIAR